MFCQNESSDAYYPSEISSWRFAKCRNDRWLDGLLALVLHLRVSPLLRLCLLSLEVLRDLDLVLDALPTGMIGLGLCL